MGNERRFAAINTKIRVLRSRLLKDKDYINLIQKNSVREQVEYLSINTVYRDVLKNIINFNDIQQVELDLEKYIIIQFEKIIKYFSDDYEKFYRSLMLRYEVEDLKIYLRAVGRDEEVVRKVCFINDDHYSFDCNKLITASNMNEFIENLKGTIFYDVLKPYQNEEDAKIIFYMEMNLDKLYFNTLKTESLNLSKEDRKIFEDILGNNVDLLNIEWIYRGIKFYNLLPEELINYTLPNGSIFDYNQLKEMSYSNVEKLKEIVNKTKYAFLFEDEESIDLYMALRIQRCLHDRFKKIFKKGALDISISLAYIHLLEYEIRDIISILESKKYELTLQDTVKYLISEIKGSDI